MAAKRGLILLGNFRQWVDLSYNYDAQTSETAGTSTSSSQQRVEEDYHFLFDYAIYHPRLLRGQFAGDLKLDQQYISLQNSSSSTYGTGLLYKLSGTALDRTPLPISFANSLEFNNVQQEFARSYDLTVSTNSAGFSLNNKFLPVNFSYTSTSSETSGLVTDRIENNEIVLLNMTNAVANLSQTNFNLQHSKVDTILKGTSETFPSRSFEVNLHNVLNFPKEGKSRNLDSTLQLHQQAGVTEYSSITLAESLTWELGKALSSSLGYSYNYRNAPQAGTETSHEGHFQLQHRFVQSVATQLELSARRDNLSIGTEQEMGGGLGVSYQKKLPAESSVQVNFTQRYMVNERNLINSDITVFDEPHTVAPPALIFLNKPDVIPGSVIVRNAVTGVPFTLTIDYNLVPFGAQTEIVIVPGGGINVGDTLLVTYAYRANPQISFATTTRRLSVNLPLFNYAYRFYGHYATMNQDLLSGQADITTLVNSREYQLGVECKRNRLTFGGEYGNFDSDQDKHEYYEGHARIHRQFGVNSLGLNVSDRYTITYPTSFSSAAIGTTKQNTITAGAVYNRPLIDTAQLLMTGNYISTRGSILNRDNAMVMVNVRWNHGKLMLSLNGQVNWQFLPGNTTRDDHLRLQVTRYF